MRPGTGDGRRKGRVVTEWYTFVSRDAGTFGADDSARHRTVCFRLPSSTTINKFAVGMLFLETKILR